MESISGTDVDIRVVSDIQRLLQLVDDERQSEDIRELASSLHAAVVELEEAGLDWTSSVLWHDYDIGFAEDGYLWVPARLIRKNRTGTSPIWVQLDAPGGFAFPRTTAPPGFGVMFPDD